MFAKLYFIALPVFFATDMVWLGLIAKNFYRAQIGDLMKSDVNWGTMGSGVIYFFRARGIDLKKVLVNT